MYPIVRIQEIMANNELLAIKVKFCIQAQLGKPRLKTSEPEAAKVPSSRAWSLWTTLSIEIKGISINIEKSYKFFIIKNIYDFSNTFAKNGLLYTGLPPVPNSPGQSRFGVHRPGSRRVPPTNIILNYKLNFTLFSEKIEIF